MIKPQLADNYIEANGIFPVWQQPKIDGVRGLFLNEGFTGRSLKPFKNKALTRFYSQPVFKGLDGELVLHGGDTQERLCSLTTGLVNRINDPTIPDFVVFDYITPETIGLTYALRYAHLRNRVRAIEDKLGDTTVRIIPYTLVENLDQVLTLDASYLVNNYEGSILRNFTALYKAGRPTKKGQELMRIKRFMDFEVRIFAITEAMENQNEAKTNELGRTERSAHKENKVGKGMMGMVQGEILEDIMHEDRLLFKKGLSIDIGPGQTNHAERLAFWKDPSLICGQIWKVRSFPQGVKDLPRFPLLVSPRALEDMS